MKKYIIAALLAVSIGATGLSLYIQKPTKSRVGYEGNQAQPFTITSQSANTAATTTNQFGDILPQTDNAFSLGSAAKRWKNLQISGTLSASSTSFTNVTTTNLAVTNQTALSTTGQNTTILTVTDAGGIAGLRVGSSSVRLYDSSQFLPQFTDYKLPLVQIGQAGAAYPGILALNNGGIISIRKSDGNVGAQLDRDGLIFGSEGSTTTYSVGSIKLGGNDQNPGGVFTADNQGNVSASGTLFQASNIVTNGGVTVGGNVTTTGQMSATGDLLTAGALSASSTLSVFGTSFLAKNNNSFVGIGNTTTPSALLAIQGRSGNNLLNIMGTGGERVFAISENGRIRINTSSVAALINITTTSTIATIKITSSTNGSNVFDVNQLGQVAVGDVADVNRRPFVVSGSEGNGREIAGFVNTNAAGIGGFYFSNNEATASNGFAVAGTSVAAPYGGNLILYTDASASSRKINIMNRANNSIDFYSGGAAAGNLRMTITGAGLVGIASTTPTFQLSVNGPVGFQGLTVSAAGNALCYLASGELVHAGGNTCATSNRASKTDIEPFKESAITTLNRLQAVTYKYKKELRQLDPNEEAERIGLIADDVAKVDNRLVDYKPNGEVNTLNFDEFNGLYVKAFQEQQIQIHDLQEQIIQLQAKVGGLEWIMREFKIVLAKLIKLL